MRIIAGEFRGRKLLGPADQATRPITDRVKQAMFDTLMPYLAGGGHVYDVFAGTGSFGLESMSRGASGCTFFERHKPALERLRRNIETLGIVADCTIRVRDIYNGEFLDLPEADVIFLDPPYEHVRKRTDDVQRLIDKLSERLRGDGVIVFRHDKADDDVFFEREQSRRSWGGMTVRLCR